MTLPTPDQAHLLTVEQASKCLDPLTGATVHVARNARKV